MSIGGGAGYAPTGLGSGVGFGSGFGSGIGSGSGVRVHFGSFSSASSFYNPSLPFQVPVNGFAGDSRIRVVLVPHPDAVRFAINFYRGEDILLHFNPRFTEDQLVLNSTRNGSYGDEERRPNPLQRGEIYTVEFIAEPGNAIRIYVNGEHVTTFHARPGDDFSDVDSIKIDESLKVHSVSINA